MRKGTAQKQKKFTLIFMINFQIVIRYLDQASLDNERVIPLSRITKVVKL